MLAHPELVLEIRLTLSETAMTAALISYNKAKRVCRLTLSETAMTAAIPIAVL